MRHSPIRNARRVVAAGLGLALLGCSYGPDPDRRIDFVLTFPPASTTLDTAAGSILARAAAAAKAAPDLDVVVAGYADASITPESNQIASRLRAQAVADALLAQGVARARITLAPRRAIGADPGTESARVEIRIGS